MSQSRTFEFMNAMRSLLSGADAKKMPARYIRVNGGSGSFVALNEIEVFGKK